MIRPVIPRRFVVRTTALAAAAAILAACSADAGPPGASPAPPVAPAASVSHALPDDPVRMLLPATGAETRWSQGLDTFGQQVAHAAAVACAHNRGIDLPPTQPPPAFIRLFELPDLDFVARHGFSQSAVVPDRTPVASPDAARSGTPDAIRSCLAAGAAAAKALRDAYAPLQQRWFSELTSLRRDPATVRALGTLPSCLAGHGINVPDENGFFALADARLQSAAPVDAPHTDRALGRVYAACMRPVEAVREPARLRLRTRFLTEHAAQVGELRKNLVASLRQAEKRYGVRLSFPAP